MFGASPTTQPDENRVMLCNQKLSDRWSLTLVAISKPEKEPGTPDGRYEKVPEFIFTTADGKIIKSVHGVVSMGLDREGIEHNVRYSVLATKLEGDVCVALYMSDPGFSLPAALICNLADAEPVATDICLVPPVEELQKVAGPHATWQGFNDFKFSGSFKANDLTIKAMGYVCINDGSAHIDPYLYCCHIVKTHEGYETRFDPPKPAPPSPESPGDAKP